MFAVAGAQTYDAPIEEVLAYYSVNREGFGPYVGFTAAWGYWACAWVGNVACLQVVSTLGR